MTPTWSNMLAPFAPTVLSAQDNIGWISDGTSIYHYDNTLLNWVSLTAHSGSSNITSLSASSDGSLITADSTGTYLYNLGAWTQLILSSYPTSCVAGGDCNDLVIVDSTGTVTKSVYTVLTVLASGPAQLSATSALGNLWGVSSTGTVLKYNTSTAAWDTVSGKTLTQVHASISSTGTLQIVGVDSLGKGWSYSGTAWSAISVPNSGDKFARLQAGAGFIWAVTTAGDVYRGAI